ncbi:MAG: DUF488 family protein [Cyanobacteria bacterium P01_H01_bin.121]
MFFFASYFAPTHHIGTAIAISQRMPTRAIAVHVLSHPLTQILMPPDDLLWDWRCRKGRLKQFPRSQDIERFRDRYLKHYEAQRPRIEENLDRLRPRMAETHLTLCCYEPAGSFCHRYLVAWDFWENYRELYGGCDVTGLSAAPAPPPLIEPMAVNYGCGEQLSLLEI